MILPFESTPSTGIEVDDPYVAAVRPGIVARFNTPLSDIDASPDIFAKLGWEEEFIIKS